jgi:O-antigen/teichoic acid export membrane protein
MSDVASEKPSLSSRLMRGAGQTALGFVAAQALRFGSNLILARLLFPEAFGLMALVTVILVGAVMMSDAGIGQSIRQSPRGDDPAFLDTAWTMQVVRGLGLWAVIAALGWPASQFFSAPELLWMLPVAGVTLFFAGLEPMKAELAYRHLAISKVTIAELSSQIIGLSVMIALAAKTGSVWSLVAGMVVSSACKTTLFWISLPGPKSWFAWESRAAAELYRFGVWIFMSSAFGFLLAQGDKAILGRFLTRGDLGIYNIAYFLASAPMLLAGALTSALLLPAYRIAGEDGGEAKAKLKRLRFGLSATVMAILALLTVIGPWLVEVLYDARYQSAGTILVWIALVQMWPLIGLTYDQAALAAGDSRTFFWVIALRAVVQTLFFIAGFHVLGLQGALIGQAMAVILIHPAVIWIARAHKVWDPRHDMAMALVAAGFAVYHFGFSGAG